MQPFEKPRIGVSRCLGFAHCRYDGAMISDEFVDRLRVHVNFIPVCPEVEIGLGIPRATIRAVLDQGGVRLLQPSTGRDFTAEMETFAVRFLNSHPEVEGFLLKSRSPSCGVRDAKIFDGEGNIVGKGAGFFARAVMDLFPGGVVEDEGRLTNFSIREHFLTRIFALARFRAVRISGSLHELIRFQSENKLLFMAYNQRVMRKLGNIAANPEHRSAETVITEYGHTLPQIFVRAATCASHINVLMHAMGYFSTRLSGKEKAFFLDAMERFRRRKIPLSALIGMMMSWIARFGESWLADQTYFQPYPEALVEITDSGAC
ncbi:MAG: YbgA family protein [Candidatus Latescibacterota bacterium]